MANDLKLVNVEAVLVSYLRTNPFIAAAGVATQLPNPRPAKFVRVQRIGGDEKNMIQERPFILVECWGSTQTEAWTLAAACWEALRGREPLEHNGFELLERRVSSPVNYPDPSTTSPRYQFQLQTTVNLKGMAP